MRVELYRKSGSFRRLDVGPFVLLYCYLHFIAWSDKGATWALVVIPIALVTHVMFFLSQRWSVRCLCAVSYLRCDNVAKAQFALVTDGDQTGLVDVTASAEMKLIFETTPILSL